MNNQWHETKQSSSSSSSTVEKKDETTNRNVSSNSMFDKEKFIVEIESVENNVARIVLDIKCDRFRKLKIKFDFNIVKDNSTSIYSHLFAFLKFKNINIENEIKFQCVVKNKLDSVQKSFIHQGDHNLPVPTRIDWFKVFEEYQKTPTEFFLLPVIFDDMNCSAARIQNEIIEKKLNISYHMIH